jgi:predicted CXXCH cytochrome family protein
MPGSRIPFVSPRLGAVIVLAGGLALLGASAPTRFPRGPAAITGVIGEAAHVGDCSRCHKQHGGDAIVYEHALVGPDDNTLCASCHSIPWQGSSYPGTVPYAGSAHGSEPAAVWPGPVPPPRTEPGAAGKCLNCHDPHGWEDAAGVVPGLRLGREEALCLACHDGSPASDVRTEQLKPYRHPTQDFSGRHTGAGEALPSDFGAAPLNRRHAECDDCHNAHLARGDRFAPGADQASKKLLGVSRVAVVNGPAGTPPTFTFIAGQDTLSDPGGDWQVCFKCHSSWTTQPSGQTDLARMLNPNNPSYHPVEASGANPGIDLAAFAPGWNPMSRTPCGSCHGSDSPAATGPHGSLYPRLLKSFYDPAPGPRAMASDELCFRCHDYDVYANPSAPEAVRAASRFNAPGAVKGHAEHVVQENVPCGACHASHGSTTLPHLLVTGRVPGITSYTQTPTGGTCGASCHGSNSYTANYAR